MLFRGAGHGKRPRMLMKILEKQDGRYWGYGYVRANSEKKVLHSLERLGLLSFLPTVPVATIHHYTKVVTHVPMIRGYVFFCLNEAEKSELLRQEERLVHAELLKNPAVEKTFLTELNELARCEELALKEPIRVNPGILPGDDVLVTSGPLAGLTTKVVRRNDARDSIIINISILNRYVEYPVSAETLKKITA